MVRRLFFFGIPLYLVIIGVIVYVSMLNQEAEKVALQGPGKLGVVIRPEIPNVQFKDVTESAGIRFQHHSGAYGGHNLPEVMGPGVAFLDYDNDGDQDLLIVNSCNWPFHESSSGPGQPTHAFYENDGRGGYRDVTEKVGLNFSSYGMGACCGDIDNDGFIDLYITGYEGNFLLRNIEGQRFEDVTQQAGVRAFGLCTSTSFVDYDRDGRLDLFVCSYVLWSPKVESELDEFFKVTKRDFYRGPDNFMGQFCFLFRNCGGLKFEDVSDPAGIRLFDTFGRPRAKALGVAVCDYNNDGWPDIAVANDRVANFLFQNRKNGTFQDIAIDAGTSHDTVGRVRAGMGIAWADYRNNGSIGLLISNFTNEMCGLYLANRELPDRFVDVAMLDGIGADTRVPVSWGLFFFDYDLNGWLDIYITNGHLSLDYQEYHNIPYAQRPLLFWNSGPTGRGFFWNVSAEQAGLEIFRPIVGRGAAYADIDGDGDLDLMAVTNLGRAYLYRNEGSPGNHFLRLNLEGRESNRSAIGSMVRVRAGNMWQRREVTSGSSYLSQNELALTFGLGQAAQADQIEVTWPAGKKEVFNNVRADRTLHLVEGQGLTEDFAFSRPGSSH